MVSDESTRKMVQELRKAGWQPRRHEGSHSWWECPTGLHGLSVVDGHRTMAAPMVRKTRRAIQDCDCGKGK